MLLICIHSSNVSSDHVCKDCIAGVNRGGGLPHPLSYLMGGAHSGAHVV